MHFKVILKPHIVTKLAFDYLSPFVSSAGWTKMVTVLLLLLDPILLHSFEKSGGREGLQGVIKGGRGDS